MVKKSQCEYLRQLTKQRFDQIRGTWVDLGLWAYPARIKWLLSQTPGERNNQHIVDNTHTLALRSFVAGFLEGNTSASRPWIRMTHKDPELSNFPANKLYLDAYTRSILNVLSSSNFYDFAGQYYYDFGVFNTGGCFIEELPMGRGLFFHSLVPGSYYTLNDAYGSPNILVREFTLDVNAIVKRYGRKVNGKYDWSNISGRTRKMYEESNYSQKVDVVQVIQENEDYDPSKPIGGKNRRWCSHTYELGGTGGQYLQDGQQFGTTSIDPLQNDVWLSVSYSQRKPFVVGRSYSTNNFEYGEMGPTLWALGTIKSLNKKAIAKDQAIEQTLRPAIQGPANLKKSYLTTAPNSFVPLDPQSLQAGGLRRINEIGQGYQVLIQDVEDLRQQVDKLYYADFLLYLSKNPKTRTATETNAILAEQQLVIGPNLQSLNHTFNEPIVDFVAAYVLDYDPQLQNVPESLQGEFLKTDFISVFAQAQKAADLPAMERFVGMIEQVGQFPGGAAIWDKVNLDRLADLYEDRLFLPAGLNRPQTEVDARREAAQAQFQQQQLLNETVPNLAGAAKNLTSNQK